MKENIMKDFNREESAAESGWSEHSGSFDTHSSHAGERSVSAQRRRAYGQRQLLKGSAGRAEPDEYDAGANADHQSEGQISGKRDRTAEILDEVEQKRQRMYSSANSAGQPFDSPEAPEMRSADQAEDHPKAGHAARPKRAPRPDTSVGAGARAVGSAKPKKGKKKKSRNYSLTYVLRTFIPWRGDSGFEAVRKIIFSTALAVVGVCTFLISSYYIDLYQSKKEYMQMQDRLEEARNNRHFNENTYLQEIAEGGEVEYLEYNEVADLFLPLNPDLVGYIRIKDTNVSYPVVQKKSKDVNDNKNDYYLYRTFRQEDSRSGCIFMDYRCHFDEVVDHRRIVDNSDNLLIYGHNMNNRTMFGCLRDYVNNPSFYMSHPIVELQSIYCSYVYKIFAVLIVDGVDFDSEYAFDCWNTFDFEDEDAFYDYVNNAKKRTLINTNVDVEYGDPILTLYTCNGLHANAKLILMCRRVRAGEDLYAGTENATLNDNVLYTKTYYDMGHAVTFDPDKFVPYGPKS